MTSPSAPEWVRKELRGIGKTARRTLTEVEGPVGARLLVGGRGMLNFSSNDYLGLANHPALVEGAAETARRWGAGAGASRLITGTLGIHRELERGLADLKGTETALLFSTGYHANAGILQGLMPEGTIFSDELNHASIVDGCRLSRAETVVYRHRDTAHLAELLAARADAPRKLIVTDGVFSMDGDLAPLPELAGLAERHGALLVVDDAHATGVLGGGRGSGHHLGVADRIHVHMGTLGKALGSFGAFAATSGEIADLLVNRARSFIFTTAPPPSAAGAALAALEILRREPERPARLLKNATALRDRLKSLGFALPDDPTPILPVILGANRRTLAWSRALWDLGFWVHPIRPPTVPEGSSRLRVTVTADHGPADLAALCEAMAKLLSHEPETDDA